MKDIINLTAKNFKLAFRTKTAIFTLLVAPIVIIVLLAMAFNNTGVYNINIGMYAESYSDVTDQLVENLNEKQFKLVKMNSEEFCVDQVKQELVNLCMVFPPNLQVNGSQSEIIFHVDPSKVNLVSQVVDIITEKIALTSDEISVNLTTNLLDRITDTREELEKNKGLVSSLRQNIDNLDSHNERIKASLTAIDLGEYQVSNVTDSSSTVKDKVNSLTNVMISEISALRDVLDTIEEAESDLGGGELEVKEDLEGAIEDLNESITVINQKVQDFRETADEFDEVNAMVGSLEGEFNDVAGSIQNVINEQKASEVILSNATASAQKLDASFEGIESALAGVQVAEAEGIVNPFRTTIKPVVKERSHLNLVYAGIVMMIVMFVAILLSSTIVMMERKSKSYLLNYMTPTKDISFVISQYITIMTLLVLQAVIIVAISAVFFKAQILGNIPQIAVILFISLSFFVLLGMLIAYFFNAEQTITLVSIATGSLFLLLSNIILPIELMPRAFQAWVRFNPFLIAEAALKRVMQFNASFVNIWGELATLIIYSVVVFVLIMLVEGLLKRKGLIKFVKSFKKK